MSSALEDAVEMAHGFNYRLTPKRYSEACAELRKNTLARDLVALLFWRWVDARRLLNQTVARQYSNDLIQNLEIRKVYITIAHCHEQEALEAFESARAYLYSKTKGDE